ncbi:sugar ABC transporter ATP-binding protein [Siminovitchia terrae]|uniref:Sugar ABC transporter ATP-binding protein n=1 Tax=Siminovitchia terrae TaxID=1914933 RepID=A0A429XE35_SIMTE|nr:sugar ABC transporter ATP-binding protein [Siminovitchia terrae]RST61728.1 sugar ABC transporter ATP-binding protein [Siminovitchia terrae]
MKKEPINQVEMLGISKSFGRLSVLNKVNFSARAGEVHCLMGENGAGKSTLMKILSGAYQKDEGEIFIKGEKVNIIHPKDGRDQGISVIYQEFALAKDLTVAENIFIDNLGSGKVIISWRELCAKASELLEQLGFGDIDVEMPVSKLSVAYQQVVEICKALSRNSTVLVLDEPTAVLTTKEVEKLFQLIDNLKKKGVCIIYISHRLEEIFRMCDRITVLRDGNNVSTVNVKDIDKNTLVNLMIGRDLEEFYLKRKNSIGEVVLKVEKLTSGNLFKNITFEVRAGEVLGLSGLIGAGRTETMRAIFGIDKKDSGKVYLHNKPLTIKTPKQAVECGIAMLPEDRKSQGVLLNMSVKNNATLSALKNFTNFFGWINKRKENASVNDLVSKLGVKTASIDSKVSNLSGGNQQKVALMKWLNTDSKVLILDEPTRGVDVAAKVGMYEVINQLAAEGKAIIIVSSEMPEIIGTCDRVLVMREGEIMGELSKEELTEQNLIRFSMGVS